MSRVLKDATNQITNKYNAITHKGIDLVKNKNQACDIIAHSDGKVILVKTGYKNDKKSKGADTWGNRVMIDHNNGYYTQYAHLKSVNVKVGDKVSKGQVIGYMGDTGNAYGVHLHFELYKNGTTSNKRINPTPYIDASLPEIYQVYDNVKNKWLPKVQTNTNNYAGNFKNGISGLKCTNLTYRVHDNVKNKWLPWITGDSDYAGNLPNNIDGLQVKNATYRVHIKGGKWLAWVSKVDDTSNGYAGIYGKDIDAIQIKVD